MLTMVGPWKWNQVKESKERGLQLIGTCVESNQGCNGMALRQQRSLLHLVLLLVIFTIVIIEILHLKGKGLVIDLHP